MILSLDLGSTAFKAAVFDPELRRLGEGSAALEYHCAAGGIVEMDAGMVVAAMRAAIGAALEAAGCRADRLCALAIASQAQTFTVADSAGRPRRAFISWQDARAETGREALLADAEFADTFAAHCSFPTLLKEIQVAQLRLLHDAMPGWIRVTDRVVGLPEYVLWLASGNRVVDDNLAAMGGLYSRLEGRWWPRALELCGLRNEQLAEVVPIGSAAAVTGAGAGEHFGLPPGIACVVAGNDQTAGAYGAQVRERGALLLTLGTAQVAYTCEPATQPAEALRIITGPYPGGGTYRLAVEAIGGNVVNWAERVVQGGSTDEGFFALAAASPPGANGVRFVPDVPHGNGAWSGLALHHTPADLARSVLEALTDRMSGMVQWMGLDVRRVPLLAAGGGSRQPLWVGMVSGALGRPVALAQADPLTGAARMACEALGKAGRGA